MNLVGEESEDREAQGEQGAMQELVVLERRVLVHLHDLLLQLGPGDQILVVDVLEDEDNLYKIISDFALEAIHDPEQEYSKSPLTQKCKRAYSAKIIKWYSALSVPIKNRLKNF